MKERLKELLLSSDPIKERDLDDDWGDGELDEIVDHLLANGVIVPPCKMGDTVYCISESRIVKATATEINMYGGYINITVVFTCDYNCKGCPFNSWSQDYSGEYSCNGEYGEQDFEYKDFGKTVFLTKEEAEAALKERSGK